VNGGIGFGPHSDWHLNACIINRYADTYYTTKQKTYNTLDTLECFTTWYCLCFFFGSV